MAKTNLILLLVVSLLVMISVAHSKRLAVGFGGKNSAAICNLIYGAEEGDTCSRVAQDFKLSLNFFLSINPNINCNSIFVGQWLCIDGTPQ
ncbi:hypothetical protein M0R45_033025 [Rubus argutus]|uniref:LysM domain-containing protein n=1 Tax=Rubus argutus TaxID=59490 RepID=A0AAW1WLP3_RUBAR